MTFSMKQMEDRIEWLKSREADLRAGPEPILAITDRPEALEPLSPLAAANTLNLAIEIIAELAGRLSAAEELLADARKPKKARNFRGPEED